MKINIDNVNMPYESYEVHSLKILNKIKTDLVLRLKYINERIINLIKKENE